MAKKFKEERAGRLVRCSLYSMQSPRDGEQARAAKSKLSSLARSRMNAKTSWEKCRLKLAANFSTGDLFVTLTYSEDNLPPNRKAANGHIKAWLRLMRLEYERAGADQLRYIYATEVLTSKGRYHHHLVMNRVDNARELLQSMWRYGTVDVQFLDETRLSDLAKYLTKEAAEAGRKVGQQAWTPSRNLRSPARQSSNVPDGFTLALPPGCILIDNPSTKNSFGEFAYLEYLLPEKHN